MAAIRHDCLVFKVFNPRTAVARNQLLSTYILLNMGTLKLNGLIIHIQFNQPSTESKSESPFNSAGITFSFLLLQTLLDSLMMSEDGEVAPTTS